MNTSMMRAFEAVEAHLETEAGDTPAALLTISENPKFFSNGIDPDCKYTKDNSIPTPTKDESVESGIVGMSAFFRPLQLPIPTVAAINGHAFGAGMYVQPPNPYHVSPTAAAVTATMVKGKAEAHVAEVLCCLYAACW